MRLEARADVEEAALGGLLAAATRLLDRLRAAPDPAARAALGAEFDAHVVGLRAELMRGHGLDAHAAEAAVARAATRLAELVRGAVVA